MDRFTDTGNAEALIEQFGSNLRYCPRAKEWYVWTGKYWEEDINKSIIQMAKGIAKGYMKEAQKYNSADSRNRDLVKHAKSSESLRSIQAMVLLAQSSPEVLIPLESFDYNPYLLNVANGTIGLDEGVLYPFDRNHNITKIAPVVFKLGAQSKKWDKFLKYVVPDADTRDFLQRAVGYSLTGHTTEDVMFILYGRGQNGKTTFVSTLLNMLGEYAAQASSTILMQHGDAGPSNALYVLIGKRFVAAAETGETRQLDETLVKQMTGMDRISVNPKYKSQIEFTPSWKLWLSTNHEPTIKGNDAAIWRRIRKIPFNVVIPESKRDPNLKLTLFSDMGERSGILNWALEGVRRWRESGLKPSKQVYEATNAYKADQDIIGQFLTECCQFHSQLVVPKAALYKAYRVYCHELDEKPKTKIGFGHRLRDSGIKEDRDRNNRYWGGIGIDERVNLFPVLFKE